MAGNVTSIKNAPRKKTAAKKKAAPVKSAPDEVDDPEEKESAPRSNSGAKIIVERLERLEEERQAIAADMKEIRAEAKASGHNVKAINTAIRIRASGVAEHERFQDEVDQVLHACGNLRGR